MDVMDRRRQYRERVRVARLERVAHRSTGEEVLPRPDMVKLLGLIRQVVEPAERRSYPRRSRLEVGR